MINLYSNSTNESNTKHKREQFASNMLPNKSQQPSIAEQKHCQLHNLM